VRVIDGADATEPTRTVEEEIPVPAGPDVLRRVEERGAPGRVRKEVGVRSGEVVDTEALVAARAPTTTTRKVVALTFDDGPSASWTPYVLEILRSRGVRATFCMVGTAVEKAPEVAAQVVAAGHQVCNHTQSHDLGLAEADQARVDAEVQGGRATMLAAGLPEPPFYRPPGGNLSDPVIATARAQGERVLMWKVDTRDWSRSATVESVLANLRSQVEPGAIVLLHDAGGSNRFTSLAVLAGLIDELRAQGYEFTFPVIDPA
jgi:peptidoglycan/xylan/chitin deacetylase (PgdA/CDA1 family)